MTIPFSYSIRRSQRAKKMRIAVSSHKIEVIAPPQIAETLLHQFVADHKQWIIEALKKSNIAKPTPLPHCLFNTAAKLHFRA